MNLLKFMTANAAVTMLITGIAVWLGQSWLFGFGVVYGLLAVYGSLGARSVRVAT